MMRHFNLEGLPVERLTPEEQNALEEAFEGFQCIDSQMCGSRDESAGVARNRDVFRALLQRLLLGKVWIKVSCRECNQIGVYSTEDKAKAENYGWCSLTVEAEVDSEERVRYYADF